MQWFRRLIEEEAGAIGKNHGWKSKLARKCGVSPATITDWLNHGKNPDAFTAFSVLQKLGGDIERALPGWSPESHDTSLPCAKIRAGTESYVPEVDAEVCDPIPAIWRKKKWAQWGDGRIFYVIVDGDSMEPEYPNGATLVCSLWGSSMNPMHRQPVIARVDDDGYTFKLWSETDDGTVVLMPINPIHKPIVGACGRITPHAAVIGILTEVQ